MTSVIALYAGSSNWRRICNKFMLSQATALHSHGVARASYFRVAGGIMDHLRFKAIFLQYGSNETKTIIAIILSNIISNEMHTVR